MTMTMEDIKASVADDMLAIDEADLDREAMRIPSLIAKYSTIAHDEAIEYASKQKQHRFLRKQMFKYYAGRMTKEELAKWNRKQFPYKLMSKDLDAYICGDDYLNNMEHELQIQKAKMDYIDWVLKSIQGRQWNIKNAIEWRKFMSGG